MTSTESGRVQVVYTANVGSPLAADVAAGDLVITVDDTSDFDTDGTLQVAGQTVAYSAVDDDTGEVTLDAAVTGAAESGDPVTLWDTGLDRAAVEYRAHVALPGVLDNADAVDATIRHTLIGYLAEGIRTPGTGESVRMERQGLDWVIVDLLGKRPNLPSNVVTGDGAGLDPVSITTTLPGPGSSVADSDKSIAIGDGANVDVTSLAGIAIGSGAYAFSPDDSAPLAIGWDASAEGSDAVAIGDSARSAADRGTAVGSAAFAGGVEAVAIGRSQASGAGSIAIGSTDGDRAIAYNDGDIAIGGDALATGSSGTPPLPGHTSAVAIGLNAYANSHSVAVGERANADVAGVTVGSSIASWGNPGQTAIGHDLIISAPYSTVVGYQGQSGDYGTSTDGAGSVALGAYAKARKDNSVALGRQADANAAGAVAIGCDSTGAAATATAADDFLLGTAAHKVKVAGRLNVAQRTPFNTADPQGTVGDITSDLDYLYVKTVAGWKRVALSTFAAAPGAATGTASMTLAATATAASATTAASGTAAMSLAATATAGAAPAAATGTASMSLAASGTAAAAPGAASGTAAMSLAATATAVASYSATVLADSPGAYYRLDDASGNFADSSGNGRTATVTGTPTYLQPPAGSLINGNSVTFAGSQYGDAGTTSFLNAPSALTVEAWVKFTSTATITIVGRDNSGGGTLRGWRLRAIAGNINWLVFSNVSTTSATISSPLTYNDGNWHHVVATATNSGSMFLYVDGAQVATTAMAFAMAGTNINGEDTFVGASHSAATWIGSLDEVAIYTTALSSTRVLAHYNAGH